MKFISQFCKYHKKEIFLFLLMLFLELAMIFALRQGNGLPIFFRSDGTEYQTLVFNLINSGEFSLDRQAPFIPTDYRTPAYPVWLAILYLIFKSFKPAIFIGSAIFAFSAPLVYLIGKEIFKEKIAFLSALLFAVEPWAIFQSGFLAAEQIAMPTFLLSVYLFCCYLKSGRYNYLYFASSFLGLATLIRPVTLYFILIFAFLTFVAEQKHSIFRSFKTLALTVLIFITVLSPWLIRNKIVLNTWQLSSAASNGVLYIEIYNLNKYLRKITDEHEWEKAALLVGTRNYELFKRADVSKIIANYAVEEIKANRIAFIKMHVKSMLVFFVKNSYGNIFLDLGLKSANVQSKIAGFLYKKDFIGFVNLLRNIDIGSAVLAALFFFWPTIVILAILGIYYIFIEDYRNSLFWFLLLWILYFPALTSDLFDTSRYKLPINAPLFMLAVAGFYNLKNYFFNYGRNV